MSGAVLDAEAFRAAAPHLGLTVLSELRLPATRVEYTSTRLEVSLLDTVHGVRFTDESPGGVRGNGSSFSASPPSAWSSVPSAASHLGDGRSVVRIERIVSSRAARSGRSSLVVSNADLERVLEARLLPAVALAASLRGAGLLRELVAAGCDPRVARSVADVLELREVSANASARGLRFVEAVLSGVPFGWAARHAEDAS